MSKRYSHNDTVCFVINTIPSQYKFFTTLLIGRAHPQLQRLYRLGKSAED